MSERLTQSPPTVKAETLLYLPKHESVEASSRPLVAAIEHVVEEFGIQDPSIVEVGPVPTFHYKLQNGGYDAEFAERDIQHEASRRKNVPPIWFLKQAHPTWRLAAVSPHDIPEAHKNVLLGEHADLFMHKLGPDRARGLGTEDVWDTEYKKGVDIAQYYPDLIKKLGGKKPDIIYGRHVFDAAASEYPVGKLTTISSMLLPIGGLLMSHVYGSTAQNSHVPMDDLFPFDLAKNMRLVKIMAFSRERGLPGEQDYVFVYQKTGDAIHPAFLKDSL